MKKQLLLLIVGILIILNSQAQQAVYQDTPFWQDKSEYIFADKSMQTDLQKVLVDRNEIIQILSSKGLLKPNNTTLVTERSYRPLVDLNILDIGLYRNEFVYLTDQAILSNAWSGKIYIKYKLQNAFCLAGGNDFKFLIGSKTGLEFVNQAGSLWKHKFTKGNKLVDIQFDENKNGFWVLTENNLNFFNSSTKKIEQKLKGHNYTGFEQLKNKSELIIISSNGYNIYDKGENKITKINQKLPCNQLTSVTEIEGQLWFGSQNGAFVLKNNGEFNYYASRRWLPDNEVKDISKGTGNSVLILTSTGLATIKFNLMTLHDKAMVYEKQVRKRHIRNGFNCDTYSMDTPGDLSSGTMVDSDNDGLWTSMYLASQLYRYAVTKSKDALQNSIEAFEAMERLHDINGIEGFPSRSYERTGYVKNGQENWHKTKDKLWEWKGTTSSDEAIGHFYAFSLVAEIIEDENIRERAINLIDIMTNHIVENDLYFVDYDGKPTQWGKWNPDYVNGFDKSVGDRKLNSSNIIAFLQTAYHFTGKEKYKIKAFELMDKYGYLENLMRPMSEIGVAEGDELSKDLSESWNHSDDEMYFLSYWYLYPYAFNNDLKQKYKAAIKDHWNIERPEKDGLWNFCYAMTGADEFDMDESIWFLKEYPLDMINWTITNSHRKDIELIPNNFREQTTKKVLPPDERPMFKHNTNCFELDRNGDGRYENSGDLYLLPYWMGRYLGVISKPKE
ncbi:MAG: hypothetical protein ABFS35_14560 [Bacteroidota bacterium]